MPSIILGEGAQKVKIEGEILSVDKLALDLRNDRPDMGRKIWKAPKEDILISELPDAIRQLGMMVLHFASLHVEQDLPEGEFVTWRPEIQAWTAVLDEKLGKDALIGFAIDLHHIVFWGFIELDEPKEVGEDLVAGNVRVGTVVAERVGMLTPWGRELIR